jgi:hypothetical protein
VKELTLKQCSHIAGGDHRTSLADDGGVGGFSSTDMALAGMGVGYAGGPMAVVAIGLPDPAPFTSFDRWLVGAVSGLSGAATTAFVGGMIEGAAMGAAFGPVGIAAGIVVAGAVYYGANELFQHANNETAYAGHVRQLSR